MQNSQKRSTTLWFIIVLVVLAIGGYIYYSTRSTQLQTNSTPSDVHPVSTSQPQSNQDNTQGSSSSTPAGNLIPAITLIGTPLSMGLYGFGDPYAVMIIGTNFATSSLVSINGDTMGNVPIFVSSDGTLLVFKFHATGPNVNYVPTVTVQVANGHLLSNSKTLTVPDEVGG